MPARIRDIRNGLHGAGSSPRRLLVFVCVVLVLVSCVCLLSGCKDSRSIKEIIHDQDAEKIDYESGEKYQVVDAEGRFIAEDTGLYEIGGPSVDSLPINLLYVSSEPETELPTSRFVYDPNSTNHSEATDNANVTPPEDQQQDWQNDDPQINPNQQFQPQNSNNQNPSNSGNTGKSGDDEWQDPDTPQEPDEPQEPQDPETPAEPEDPVDPQEPQDPEDPEEDEPETFEPTGDDPELPKVARIAAFGEVAVLVQMMGGTDSEGGLTPLVAADDQLCSSAFMSVFSDEGVDSIVGDAFVADGSGNYEPNIDQIIAAQPETVLVFNKGMFTKDQKKALKKSGISITTIPRLTSDARIMKAAKYIAQMLDESTDGSSMDVYERYASYHDALIEAVEGVRGYGSYSGIVYDDKAKPRRFTSHKFTLVVDEWDYSAAWSYGSTLGDAGQGIGLCTVGYLAKPVSYYLGVAGVINNAAAIDETKKNAGLLVPAWQFNPNELNPSSASYSRQFASSIYSQWDTAATKTTLAKPGNKASNMHEVGFGTETFPVVIVATERMKQAFLASASDSSGIYQPFGFTTSPYDMNTFHGTLVGRKAVYSAIAEDLDISPTTKAIVVNPHGLFSNWIDGSAESFLECAWAANIQSFESDWTGSAADEVKAFYQEFYRYDISDGEVQSVLNGLSG